MAVVILATVVVAATSLVLGVAPASAAAAPLGVFTAYLNSGDSPFVLPSPWQGSPGVTFVGGGTPAMGPCPGNCYDSGAIRLDNPNATGVAVDSVTVDIGTKHFDLWPHGTMTIPAGTAKQPGQLILTQTASINFDGSDTAAGCSNNGVIPLVHVTVGGKTTGFDDLSQSLNDNGTNAGSCGGNEDRPWASAPQAEVRIAQVAFSAPDIVRDRMGALPQAISDFASGCPVSKDNVEWKDCSPALPDGKPEKDWPIAVVRGTQITITSAVFKVRAGVTLNNVTVTGKADFGNGVVLSFTQAGLSQVGDTITTGAMTSDVAVPNVVGQYTNLNMVRIQWTVSSGASALNGGTSSHPVYVLFNTPTSPLYESLVDLTTGAARGLNTANGVVAATYVPFTGRAIQRRNLDPVSGSVSDGGLLQYWTTWDLRTAISGGFSCPPNFTTYSILRTLIGRCGAWAAFFVDTLGDEGIASSPVAVDTLTNFPAFPDPGGKIGTHLMLVNNWTFAGPTGAGNFNYVTTIAVPYTWNGTKYVAGAGTFGAMHEVDDAPGIPGQGATADPNPPGWFLYGDHAVVLYNNQIWDPSYGTPVTADGAAWATQSLAGFAILSAHDSAHAAQAPFTRTWTILAHMGT
ncbi:MAG: hypothetical protein M3083_16505 [Actinomycetota bacterium]|nr:hypothetical protein [Actinomycetota bacterium]MDQ6946440.1 hypothetical protein [Actinomycetota bacterium]